MRSNAVGDGKKVDNMGFVALSRFQIGNDMGEEVKSAFRARPHLVDDAKGFRKMDVMCPQDCPEEIWLITHWDSEEDFRTWHHSHMYKESHQGIPKGLKLVPKSAEMRFFEHICS